MPSPLTTKLTHRWPFASNANDTIGTAHFTVNGSVSYASGQIPGVNALTFGAGAGDFLSHTRPGGSDIDFSLPFTLSWWSKSGTGSNSSTFLVSCGVWGGREFAAQMSVARLQPYLGNGVSTSFIVGSYNAPNQVANEWVFNCVINDPVTKIMTVYIGRATQSGEAGALKKSTFAAYAGTVAKGSHPFKINGLTHDANPIYDYLSGYGAASVQEMSYAPSKLTDSDILALYNRGQGLLPPYTEYPSEGAIPSLTSQSRLCVQTAPQIFGMGQSWAASGQDTWITPQITVDYPTKNIRFRWINAVTSFTAGESIDAARHANVTIKASYFVEGDAASIPLTFGGASTKTLAYGEYADSDPVTNRIIFQTDLLRVLTYASADGGVTWMPATMQLYGTSGRRNLTTDGTADITLANYAGHGDAYGYGPSFIYGEMVAASHVDNQFSVVGDSIASGQDTYIGKLSLGSGVPAVQLGVAGRRASTTSIPANDLVGTRLVRDSQRLLWQLGVNDIWGGLGSTSLIASASTCWQRYLTGGSNVRQIIAVTLTPIADGSGSTTTERNVWNNLLRTGSSATIGAMTGAPTLVKRWNGTEFVASDSRSTGTGAPINFLVIDTAEVCETAPLGTNTWNTAVVAGKVVADAETIADKVHPSVATAEAMRVLLQTQFDAALADALPEAPSSTNEDEDTMTINSSNDFAVTTEWSEVVVAAEKQFRFGFHGEAQRLWWRIAETTPGVGAVGDIAKSGETQFADTVAAGKKLWVRTDNPFTVVVHVAA